MTKIEFVEIAEAMCAYYPREPLFATEAAAQLWFDEFQDLPADKVKKALREWVRKEKRSPSIAELLRISQQYTDGKAGSWTDMQEMRRALDLQRKRTETEEKTWQH